MVYSIYTVLEYIKFKYFDIKRDFINKIYK